MKQTKTWREFVAEYARGGASRIVPGLEPPLIDKFLSAPLEVEYGELQEGPACADRSYRALLEISGRDRATWLHNLTTNQVKPLQQGEGNYAFCLNVQGRILFDLNILVRSESIWVDLDRGFLPVARKHFEKYTITEDVNIADRSDDFVRFALVGNGIRAFLSERNISHAATLPLLGTAEISLYGIPITAARTDFCGPFALDLFVPPDRAVWLWEGFVDDDQLMPVGFDAVQVCRIEAGIPWPGHEIIDEYLPAETGQLRRAVSFQKGCYLGQEVVERMRSRGVVARLLRGLLIEGDSVSDNSNLKSDISNLKSADSGVILPPGSSVADASGKALGTVTSTCRSLALNKPIAMAYLKTAGAAPNQQVNLIWEGGSAKASVIELPFTRGQAD